MTRMKMAVWTLCGLAAALATAAEVDYEKAVTEALRANKLAEVNRLCTAWAAAQPGDERPRIILGKTLLKAGMPDRALEQFELAAEANPLSPAPRCGMGEMFLTQGKLGMANREFKEALRLNRDYHPAILGKAQVRLRNGDARGALTDAKGVLGAAPQNAQARVVAGECLLALGRVEDARGEFQSALGSTPDLPDALFGLAKAIEIDGQYKEAHQQWKRFLECEPYGERAERVRNGWVVLKTERLPPKCRHYPRWSPDGKRIMYGYQTMHVMHLRDNSTVDLKVPDGGELFEPDWSSDGKRMVFRKRGPNGMVIAVYDFQPDGVLQPAGPALPAGAVAAKFSPDATKLLLSSTFGRWHERVPAGRMAIIGIDDDEVQLVPWARRDRPSRNRAAWAPDGETIVLHAYRDVNDRALFAMRLDDPAGAVQLTDNGAQNHNPAVSPDGRGVAYYVEQRGQPKVVALARLTGGATMTLGQGQTPSWSPDGRRLAYATAGGVAIAHLGGLARSPVFLSAKQDGDALLVTLDSAADAPLTVSVRYEVFDVASSRIEEGVLGDGDTELEAGGHAESRLSLGGTAARGECVVKLTAVTTDGKWTIKLVDVSTP